MPSRKTADTSVPITPPISRTAVHAVLQRQRRGRNRRRSQNDDRGVPQREHESHRNRPLALLHQFARHVVDRRDMVRIHRVAQAKAVRQQRRPQQQRIVARGQHRPYPRAHIERQQDSVDPHDLAADSVRRIVE